MQKQSNPSVDTASVKPSLGESACLFRLAKAVRSRRQILRLSAGDVATQAELSLADIEALEDGKWDIDILSLIAIADCLKLNLNDLFAGVEEPVTAEIEELRLG